LELKAIKFPDNRERRADHKPARKLIYNFLIIANAFGDKSQSALIQKTLSDRYGYPVKVSPSGSLSYQLVIEGFETKEDANILLPELSIYGFRGLYVTQVRKKIVQPKTSPARTLSSSTRDDAMYFSIVVELATNEAGIKAQQEHILKVLRLTSYPIKQEGIYKLIITGFTTMRAAEIAYQKLLNAGVGSA
ncbi:MAG: hypothetical protein WBJ10_09515, partial [Daejeonella sp.]|uniref:hypothetical protein n=1 Tax=Daejeonella sp. TaxID=2805397 RepID=UPI003C740D74